MNTKPESLKTRNSWIIALFISIALNGLLVGLLISKQANQSPLGYTVPQAQNALQITPNNPRHLVRSLSPKRHKQVMTTALKNLKLEGGNRPHKLFKQLRQAKLETMRLLRADEPDMVAIETSLAKSRAIKQKIAVSGDALMIEVLVQMTPEERAAAQKAMQERKFKRLRKFKRQRKPNRH